MSPKSPYQKIVVMKGVQIGATTGILENIIAYNIGCDPKPQLYISADKELVKMNMEIKLSQLSLIIVIIGCIYLFMQIVMTALKLEIKR